MRTLLIYVMTSSMACVEVPVAAGPDEVPLAMDELSATPGCFHEQPAEDCSNAGSFALASECQQRRASTSIKVLSGLGPLSTFRGMVDAMLADPYADHWEGSDVLPMVVPSSWNAEYEMTHTFNVDADFKRADSVRFDVVVERVLRVDGEIDQEDTVTAAGTSSSVESRLQLEDASAITWNDHEVETPGIRRGCRDGVSYQAFAGEDVRCWDENGIDVACAY